MGLKDKIKVGWNFLNKERHTAPTDFVRKTADLTQKGPKIDLEPIGRKIGSAIGGKKVGGWVGEKWAGMVGSSFAKTAPLTGTALGIGMGAKAGLDDSTEEMEKHLKSIDKSNSDMKELLDKQRQKSAHKFNNLGEYVKGRGGVTGIAKKHLEDLHNYAKENPGKTSAIVGTGIASALALKKLKDRNKQLQENYSYSDSTKDYLKQKSDVSDLLIPSPTYKAGEFAGYGVVANKVAKDYEPHINASVQYGNQLAKELHQRKMEAAGKKFSSLKDYAHDHFQHVSDIVKNNPKSAAAVGITAGLAGLALAKKRKNK